MREDSIDGERERNAGVVVVVEFGCVLSVSATGARTGTRRL